MDVPEAATEAPSQEPVRDQTQWNQCHSLFGKSEHTVQTQGGLFPYDILGKLTKAKQGQGYPEVLRS